MLELIHMTSKNTKTGTSTDTRLNSELPSSVIDAATKKKAVIVGTHRICTPEETLARIQPYLAHMGITRVGDLTHLDDIGLPVFQAVRPNSRNLSVSQGKGITKTLAKVSALMEAIELWHAEEPQLPSVRAEIGEMSEQLPYSIYDLNLAHHSLLHDALPLEWVPASMLGSCEKTYVPMDYIRLNGCVQNTWLLPTFQHTSNGLASGNIREEAILHGIYEVIERDTIALVRSGTLSFLPIDPATVDGQTSGPLLERLHKAGASVNIRGMVGPTGIGCFEARITSRSYPMMISGYGCHLDRDVALSRALTEAAQVRLSVISGARDDIQHGAYREIQQIHAIIKATDEHPLANFHTMPSASSLDLSADLREATRRVRTAIPCPPLFVDLTREDFNIPVVHVVVPQMRMVEG